MTLCSGLRGILKSYMSYFVLTETAKYLTSVGRQVTHSVRQNDSFCQQTTYDSSRIYVGVIGLRFS